MSVICKVYISDVRKFGPNTLVATNCVADNEVMVMHNPDEEDKLFSKASPNGSASFVMDDSLAHHLPSASLPNWERKLYLMFVQSDEVPAFSKCIGFTKLQVFSKTNFGGTSDQFDICNQYGYQAPARPKDSRFIDQFNQRIMIDNPGAANQLVPGATDWWVGIYDAGLHTMQEVIRDAHA